MSEGFKNFVIGLAIILVLIFGGIGIKAVFFPVHVVDKSIDMAYQVTNNTLTAENAIYNYEWFKRQEASMRALSSKEKTAQENINNYIKMLPENKEKWSNSDKEELSRLQAIKTGLSNQLDDAIEEYNAKSSMVNRAIFKDNLPSNITKAYFTGKELTK